MQQLISLWQSLDLRRRIIVLGATGAMFLSVLGLANYASRPSMALLYAGIEGGSAGEVIATLEQRGVAFEVRGEALYVPAAQRDELRMMLAAEGLPAMNEAGYELLDSLSGFGTTSQMFDAAYWRAKEGELARTIAALPGIRSARVHLASAEPRGFRAENRPTASVAVTTGGGGLSTMQAKALRHLVASAVSGLLPDNVSIIDGQGGLIQAADANMPADTDRAEGLRRSVERLLEARVGYGNAAVEVSIDTVTERESIIERSFDPESRVAISSETEERTNSAKDEGKSSVTVASNLPDGDAGQASGSQSEDSETTERINYEVSETTREVERSPGAIRRLTVAAMIDGVETVDETGQTVWQPRPEEELAALRDLVAAAVGFDESRGDVITLKSMSFEPVVESGTAEPPGFLASLALDYMSLLQIAVLSIVALVLGLFVVRPILTSRAAPVARLPALQRPAAAAGEALTGEIDDGDYVPARSAQGATGLARDAAARGRSQAIGDGRADPDPVARLREMIQSRQEETAEILRSWMQDPEEEDA